MNSFFEFVRDFFGVILALLGTGGVSGWLLTRYKYNREKKQRKAHLKAKLLDEILRQCRVIERSLNKYENELGEYKRFIDFQELDPETGYPKNAFDFETLPNYSEYIGDVEEAKEDLRYKHQNYVIKTKSEEIGILNKIDESLTKLINYDDSPDFDYESALTEHLAVYTNLRMIHYQIKDVYPEEVPLD